jgi:hypothetical protein
MSLAAKEVFLKHLLSDLLSKYPEWNLEDHCKIEWVGQPKNMWPEADIIINMDGRRFIVEYDEDNDPGRNLVKYWPILHQTKQVPLTIIEIWKRGQSTGHGFATLAEWMGERLVELYPGTIYEFIERTDESVEIITERIAQMILGREPREIV